jgi:hypothetical protein
VAVEQNQASPNTPYLYPTPSYIMSLDRVAYTRHLWDVWCRGRDDVSLVVVSQMSASWVHTVHVVFVFCILLPSYGLKKGVRRALGVRHGVGAAQ